MARDKNKSYVAKKSVFVPNEKASQVAVEMINNDDVPIAKKLKHDKSGRTFFEMSSDEKAKKLKEKSNWLL